MRTIIYSEKFNAENLYSGSFTNGPYVQSGNALPKKPNTTKKLQSTVSSNKNSREIHLNLIANQQQNYTNFQIPSPHVNKAKKPTQKPIQTQSQSQNPMAEYFIQEYQKIISNLSTYQKYYEIKLKKQIEIHKDYYKRIISIVEEERVKSQQFLKNQVQCLTQKIRVQQGALGNKLHSLRHVTEVNVQSYEKELQQLKGQFSLQIPLFQVKLITIDKLRNKIKNLNFVVTTAEEIEKKINHSRITNQTINQQESAKQKNEQTITKDISAEQIAQMTSIEKTQEIIQKAKIPTNLQDKDLYCDEDIEKILKENKIMRKKRYECRQDPIPEQSESHQDSGIFSQIDTLNQQCLD